MWRSPSSSAMTRSFSVTMPTQRPPALTTGTAATSSCLKSATTSSTPASGAADGDAALRLGDERVVALEDHDRPGAARGVAGVLQAVRADGVGVELQQAG